MRGAIAGAFVVLVAGIAAWWLWPEGERVGETPPPRKEALIKEVTPAAAPKAVEKKKAVIKWRGQEYPMYNEEGGKAYVTGYGVRYHSKVVITNNMSKSLIPWEARHFDCQTDKRIAVLINTAPGTQFIGDIPYDPTFTKCFAESLKTPIIVSADDPDDVKFLKRAVIDVRKELKERMDRGEDIGQIIYDSRKELQELGAYKHELEKQVQSIMADRKMTEKDLDDCVGAANSMLESRGLPPMKVSEFYRKGIQLRERHLKGKENEGN